MKVYDKDIRKYLMNKIVKLKPFNSDPSTVIVHEMDVCSGCARIDIAVINGKIHGFEIKSEQDNLERLPSQVELYSKVFDTITIVAAENHFNKLNEIIPNWWGIYCIVKNKSGAALKTKRRPRQNKEIDVLSLTQNLWKCELYEILRLNGITQGIKSKTRFDLGKIVVNNIETGQIKQFVREKLKSRKSWRAVQLQLLYDDLHLS